MRKEPKDQMPRSSHDHRQQDRAQMEGTQPFRGRGPGRGRETAQRDQHLRVLHKRIARQHRLEPLRQLQPSRRFETPAIGQHQAHRTEYTKEKLSRSRQPESSKGHRFLGRVHQDSQR